MKASLLGLVLCAASAGAAELPLPKAPVRVVIPDAAAFDAALGGSFRKALTGETEESDPVAAAWRRTRVGSKLEDQWGKLSGELPWTWDTIRKLQPRAVGIAVLEVGHLEAVLAIDTPLARLPLTLPGGTARTHAGAAYTVVTPGAADGSEEDRRMGLAWGRHGSLLLVATSERALLLALDEALAGRGLAAPLPGLVSLELDLDALRKDRYFRREFLFAPGPEEGRVRAALRMDGGHLVEVREGAGEPRAAGMLFDAPGAVASGWEPEAAGLGAALRAALLEPVPAPSDRPLPPLAALPPARAQRAEDRYAVNLERPQVREAAAAWEEGELAQWRALWSATPVAGWGYVIGKDGARRIVFPWPAARDAELLALCRATVERRAGRATVAAAGDAQEIRVGPGLPAVALRRTGEYVWLAASAQQLAGVAAPRQSPEVVRWARADLSAVRAEGARWQKAEGPGSPEETRPLSDRILGVLGWIPDTTALALERKKTAEGWTETLVFARP
jgi:hypothetical protein